MKKKIIIGIVLFLVIGTGAYFLFGNSKPDEVKEPTKIEEIKKGPEKNVSKDLEDEVEGMEEVEKNENEALEVSKPKEKETTPSNSSESSSTENKNSSSNSSSSNKSNSDSTPKVQSKNFVVKFNSNGGTSINSQTVVENGVVTKPSNPTKIGYVFSGWLHGNNSYDFNSPVKSNIELKANWTLDKTPEFKDEILDFATLSECQNKGMEYMKDCLFTCYEITNRGGIFIGYMLTLTKKNTVPPEEYEWRK